MTADALDDPRHLRRLPPGRRTQLEFDALVHHAVELSGAHGRRPRVTFVGTASGDPRHMSYWAHEAGRVAGFDVTCLDLFPMPNLDDVPGHLLEADVVVNGGSVANLLAVWDVHDLRPAMRAAWEAGAVAASPRARSAGTSAAAPTPSAPSCGP